MFSKVFSIAALASAASAQGLAATLSGNQQTSQLAALVGSLPGAVDQLSQLQNITLLAPSNDALARLLNSSAGAGLTSNPGLLQAVLSYHILKGVYPASAIPTTATFVPTTLENPMYANVTGGQRVEVMRSGDSVKAFSGLLANSSVTQANLNFTGGVIHVIDHVLTVPQNVSTTLVGAGLSSLYGALNATGLLGTVNGLQNVTIFAPSNAAFQSIGSALGSASPQAIQSILTYHVVVGQAPLYSSSLQNGSSLPTVNGASVTIHTGNNGVFVNNAKVVIPNVLIAGGVVHVIDNVLNPNSTATSSPTGTSGAPAFSGATSVTTAPFTAGVPTPTSTIGNGSAATGARSSTAGAMPMATGAAGAVSIGALFGAGALLANF